MVVLSDAIIWTPITVHIELLQKRFETGVIFVAADGRIDHKIQVLNLPEIINHFPSEESRNEAF